MNGSIVRKLALVGALTLTASACQTLPSTAGDEARTSPRFDLWRSAESRSELQVGQLLDYHHRVRDLDEQALDEELARLRAVDEDGCHAERFHLALAELTRGGQASSSVLAPCLEDPQQPARVLRFAELLQAQLAAQRAQTGALEVLQERLEQQQRENLELRRQLDGLKAIERSLRGRDRPSPLNN